MRRLNLDWFCGCFHLEIIMFWWMDIFWYINFFYILVTIASKNLFLGLFRGCCWQRLILVAFFSFFLFKLWLRFVKWSALFRNIQNVVAKLESGLGSRHALLVNCHFDSVPQSPGNIVVVDGKFYIGLDFSLNKRWKKIGVTYLSRQKKIILSTDIETWFWK